MVSAPTQPSKLLFANTTPTPHLTSFPLLRGGLVSARHPAPAHILPADGGGGRPAESGLEAVGSAEDGLLELAPRLHLAPVDLGEPEELSGGSGSCAGCTAAGLPTRILHLTLFISQQISLSFPQFPLQTPLPVAQNEDASSHLEDAIFYCRVGVFIISILEEGGIVDICAYR